jgi:hypothetical protein
MDQIAADHLKNGKDIATPGTLKMAKILQLL